MGWLWYFSTYLPLCLIQGGPEGCFTGLGHGQIHAQAVGFRLRDLQFGTCSAMLIY